MANQIPLSGAANASGGYLLPPEQGEILVNGILVETGAIQLSGDARSTSARRTNFPIWLGRPTAGPVGEGSAKSVTGAEFGQASLNVKKFASIVLFTDEQIEDLQNGDLSVLVDAGVRQALSVSIDAHALGQEAGAPITKGSTFDTSFLGGVMSGGKGAGANTGVVIAGLEKTEIQKGISAAMGVLEENGYGNPANQGVLLGFGFQQKLRDARDGFERPLYDGGTFAGQSIDALYGLDRAHSTNLTGLGAAALTFKGTTEVGKKVEITTRGTAPLYVGQPISGKEIPAGAVIAALTGETGEETALELSVAATKAETAEVITVKRPVGVVVHKPNVHIRIRQDVVLKTSNEASIKSGGTTFNLFQENLTAVLYETRIGFLIHDTTRSVVPLWF